MPKKDVKKNSNNNDLKKPRKSFRKSVSDVKKKIFSKNKADENFEKQKKAVIEKLKYLVNKDVIKFVNKNKDRKDVKKCKKILDIDDNKNINMKELEKNWKQSYSYDELEKLKNDIEGSCKEINEIIMYKDKRIYKIDRKNSKLISSLFNDVEKKIVKIENEYNEKIKLCGNDKELSDYYNETIRPFFYSFKVKIERVFKQLGVGVEGKQIYNNLIEQMFDLLKNFPDSLKYKSVLEKKSKNFEDVENEFNKKYKEIIENQKVNTWKNATIPSGEKKLKIKIGSYREKIKNIKKELNKKEKIVSELQKKNVVDESQEKRTLKAIGNQKVIIDKIGKSKFEGNVKKLAKQFELSEMKARKDLDDELKTAEKNKDKKSVNDIKLIQKEVNLDLDGLLNSVYFM